MFENEIRPEELEANIETEVEGGTCPEEMEDAIYLLNNDGRAEKLEVPDDTEDEEEPHVSYD